MELKWKDLILAAFLLSKRNPSMAKAGYGSSIRLLLEAIRPAPLRLRPPNASHWQRKGRSQRPFISLPDPRQVAGLNRSSCCNHGPLIHFFQPLSCERENCLALCQAPKLTERASPAPLSFRRRRFASQSSCAMRSADEAVRLARPYVSCSSRRVHHVQEQELKPAAPQQRQSSLIP